MGEWVSRCEHANIQTFKRFDYEHDYDYDHDYDHDYEYDYE